MTLVQQCIALKAFVCFSESVRFKSFKRKYLTANYTIFLLFSSLPQLCTTSCKMEEKITDLHSVKVWLDTRYYN